MIQGPPKHNGLFDASGACPADEGRYMCLPSIRLGCANKKLGRKATSCPAVTSTRWQQETDLHAEVRHEEQTTTWALLEVQIGMRPKSTQLVTRARVTNKCLATKVEACRAGSRQRHQRLSQQDCDRWALCPRIVSRQNRSNGIPPPRENWERDWSFYSLPGSRERHAPRNPSICQYDWGLWEHAQ